MEQRLNETKLFNKDLNELDSILDKDNYSFLVKHLNKFLTKRLFIPFCGKTSEISWLSLNGFEVVGVQSEEDKCVQIFNEHKIDYSTSQKKNFKLFKSYDSKIKVYNGNFFDFNEEYEGRFDSIWDKVAFWSLPMENRIKYMEHMKNILSPDIRYLLHTFDSDLPVTNGPPFTCKLDDLQKVFGDEYVIALIDSAEPAEYKFFENCVLVKENLYLLKKFRKNGCNFYAF